MKNFIPQFFISMKNYSIDKFMKDLVAGLIVAIIALPLSIALALASGVTPEQGLYTAIIAGFVISFFGGSTVQISGPTAAFASIVAGIVATKGMTGLAVATFLAGIILIVMGLLKLGSLIKFIPFTITTGFTAGIAVTIAIGQLKDFMGLTFQYSPIETMEKLEQVFTCIRTLNPWAVFIGVLSLAILIFWPKKLGKIPPSLIAVLVAAT
ncbi:MAG: SulP family inorganic anion transporter, partial [Lachnospiraceae bacterium]